MYSEGFDDLSSTDKAILDKFASKILDLPTPVLLDVIKKGGLGTTQMYYTSVEPMPEDEVPSVVKHLRKEL